LIHFYKRRMKSLLFLLVAGYAVQGEFILKSVNMNEETFQNCQFCDARSDRVGSRASANALREFMKQNFVKIVVDSGDVTLTESYPNEKVETGHSCEVTAEARNIHATAAMIPGSVQLGPEGVVYIDEIKNSIAVADVRHSLSVNLDVRAWFGVKIAGHCKNVGRKTCATDGYSEGVNHLTVVTAASNVIVECIAGQEHLTFNVDAKVFSRAADDTYAPVVVGKRSDCKLDILKIPIGSINKMVQGVAYKYIGKGERFNELRGPKLVAELERKLGVKLGDTVTLKINDEHGNPRMCSMRKKRSTPCVRKQCPAEFTRIGETDFCQKAFGTTKPNCSVYGKDAKVYTKSYGGITMYWCHVPMVPV